VYNGLMAKKTKSKTRAGSGDGSFFVIFRVYARDLDPQEITEKLGIKPSTSWLRGVETAATGKKIARQYGQWNLIPPAGSGAAVIKRMEKLLSMIKPHSEVLKGILKTAHADLNIVVRPGKDQAVMGTIFPAKLIGQFTDMGIDIRFGLHST